MLEACCWDFVGRVFFNDTATTEIYTLSLHDALPIFIGLKFCLRRNKLSGKLEFQTNEDRKSTRLNSSHLGISHAVFCLKKKNAHNDLRGRPQFHPLNEAPRCVQIDE